MPKVRCEICQRDFKNQESLDMHNQAKHASPEKKESSNKKSPIGKIIAVIIALGVLFLFGFLVFSFATAGSEYKEFAQCLTEQGVKMYGAYWCPNCQEQKNVFGRSWKYIDYVECSLPNRGGQNEICNTAGIQSYPTWEFSDGSRVTGTQSLLKLSQSTSCSLPEN